jgi:hypothetical protein
LFPNRASAGLKSKQHQFDSEGFALKADKAAKRPRDAHVKPNVQVSAPNTLGDVSVSTLKG